MGLINKDIFQNRFGQELINTYISIGNNNIELKKEIEYDESNNIIEFYTLTTVFNIWLSKETRNNHKSSFSSCVIRKVLSGDEITSNLYNILYTEVKKIYTNVTDDL